LLYGAVMKKTVLALTLIMTLFSAALYTQIISLAKANPNMFIKSRYCHFLIQSPQNGTLNSAQVLLNFTVKKWDISDVYSYFYVLDGQDIQSGVKIEEIQFVGEETISEEHLFSYVETTLMGQAVLTSLSDGAHSVTVFIGEVLDDGTIRPANVDSFSTTATFNVDLTIQSPSPTPQENEQKPFPTTMVATASGVSAALACLGLLVYVKKRNGGKNLRREQP
jgi:hypothetical protein